MPEYNTITLALSDAMKQQGLSTNDLAAMTHLSTHTLHTYLKDPKRFSRRAIMAIRAILFPQNDNPEFEAAISELYGIDNKLRHFPDLYRLLLEKIEPTGMTLSVLSQIVAGSTYALGALFSVERANRQVCHLSPMSVKILTKMFTFSDAELKTLWEATTYGSYERFHITAKDIKTVQNMHPIHKGRHAPSSHTNCGILRSDLQMSNVGIGVLLGVGSKYISRFTEPGIIPSTVAYRLMCAQHDWNADTRHILASAFVRSNTPTNRKGTRDAISLLI